MLGRFFAQVFHDKAILAESVLRLVRHRDFEDQRYKDMEMQALRFIAKGWKIKTERTKVALKDALVHHSCDVLNLDSFSLNNVVGVNIIDILTLVKFQP